MPQNLKNILIRLLENRAAEDVYPTWYRFNLSEQIRAAASETNFEVVNLDQVSTSALTVLLGPLVALELLWIRWIRSPDRAGLRTNIVGVLRKARPAVITSFRPIDLACSASRRATARSATGHYALMRSMGTLQRASMPFPAAQHDIDSASISAIA